MEKKVLFSILMPNYNNSKYIREAIESVNKQTYKNWELIIVDDGSTDNSIDIIKPYLRDKRIKLFRHKKNKGCGAAFKSCIEHANGGIIGCCAPDDALHRDCLKHMIKAHKDNPAFGLIYFPLYNCDIDLNIKNINKTQDKHKINGVFTFKKSVYNKTDGFDPEQKRAVDKDIIYKFEEVTRFKFYNKPLYYYRKHNKGISQGKNIVKAKIFDYIAKEKANKRRKGTNISKFSNKSLSDMLFEIGYLYLNAGDIENSKKYFLKSIKKYPMNLKYIKTYIKRIILKS